MKTTLFVLIILLLSSGVWAANTIKSIETNNFSVYVDNYKGANQYPDGLRYKIGMADQLKDNPNWQYVNFGLIEGKKSTSLDFIVISSEKKAEGKSISTIVSILKHKYLPLQATVEFAAYDKTGVITHRIDLKNTSTTYPIRFTQIPSFEAGFAPGEYNYSYMTCGWANERKLQTKPMNGDTVYIETTSGRSSTHYSPWVSVHDKGRDIYYNAQLAWSGNWSMSLYNDFNKNLNVQFCEYFDNNQLTLLPSQAITLPEVAISGGYASIDAPANNLHRYQRQYLQKINPQNNPMLVQFNSWFPQQIDVTAENLKPYIDTAADLGIEEFTIDAGWFVHKTFEREVGEWKTNKTKFPNGLRETADYVRSRGMKFGLWFEIESAGEETEILKQHPDWCLQYNGRPVMCPDWSNRRHLDFGNPEVYQWALDQFDNMYQECGGIDWVKLDYNISIGAQFENSEGIAAGTALRNHILGFYKWLEAMNKKYPNLILENCSSGSLRMDIGMLRHVHTSFVSDETSVNPSLGMAWSFSLEYTPRMINHWVVGMDNHYPIIDPSLSRGYWDYMFRVPMNGQFGVSSRIVDWSSELKACAKENIDLYKKIRSVIADADVYHLTPQPDYKDPQDWTVLAYVADQAKQAVVMANRGRGGADSFKLKLPQLKASAAYHIEIDGKPNGSYSGATLAKEGMNIKLDNYRASVITLNEK